MDFQEKRQVPSRYAYPFFLSSRYSVQSNKMNEIDLLIFLVPEPLNH